jgi:hypothetical protein
MSRSFGSRIQNPVGGEGRHAPRASSSAGVAARRSASSMNAATSGDRPSPRRHVRTREHASQIRGQHGADG